MFKDFPFHRVNWKTSIFLILTFIISITATPYYFYTHGFDWFQVGMFFFYTVATIMSITLGYHRLFSHMSFKAKWPVRLVTLLFGAAAFENSCLSWASDHRHHHKHTDHEGDPYDISRGFFYAHIGWLLFKLDPMPLQNNVADLKRDKLVMWQDKWVHMIGLVVGVVVPVLAGYLYAGWDGALGAFLIAGILRIVVVQHCTFFINSLCHTIGTRPYNSGNTARDSAIMAFFTCGEGYHNYHHAFQHDYRNGVKPWQFDPTKWMIWVLSKLGLATDLRRVADEKILLAEMREAQRLLEQQREGFGQREASCPLRQRAEETLESWAKTLSDYYAQVEQAISDKVEISKSVLMDIQGEVRSVVKNLAKLRKLSPVSAH